MNADIFLNNYWDRVGLPVDLEKIASKVGIKILNLDPESTIHCSTIEYQDGEFVLYINPELNQVRRRFSFARALARRLLKDLPTNPTVETTDNFCYNTKEKKLNDLALDIMIPTDVLQFVILKKEITNPRTLATIFGVSEQAMIQKLINHKMRPS